MQFQVEQSLQTEQMKVPVRKLGISIPKQKQDLQYSTCWIILAAAEAAQPKQEQKRDGRLVNSTEPG